MLCFATWDDTDEENRVRLCSMITSLEAIWVKEEEKGLLPQRLRAIHTQGIREWHPLETELKEKIKASKLVIQAWWVNLFHWSFRCKPSSSHMIVKFVDYILESLNDLSTFKLGETVGFLRQIETLEEKLRFLKDFVKLSANCINSKELEQFNMFVQVFVNDAACLTMLYWVKNANDESVSETKSMLSHMLQKIKPVTPDVARLYFETLKAIYVQRSDSLIFGRTALSFVNLFLDDLMTPLKDEFRILRDNIVFLLTFLNDPPNESARELVFSQIDVRFWEGVYGFLPFDGMEGDFSRKNALLSDFMLKIEFINANISQNYGKFPDPSLYNFPKVVSIGFLDFFIQNLRNMKKTMGGDENVEKYEFFAKYMINKIEQELVSLCPLFNHFFNLQSELNETWLEVVNLVHLTEHVINSCISSWFVFDHPLWYHMTYLSDVFDKIKVVKTKLKKIKKDTMDNARCLPDSVGLISTISVEARPLENNEIIIGFEDEAEKIIGNLTRGRISLDIVSVVGMGGLGKTTLAKKVYSSSFVKCSFHVFAFCCVSQNHNTRRQLLEILRDINGTCDMLSNMTDDDLKHKLRKCLSRRKYLMVLDDIWNVGVWDEVKSSFPRRQKW